MWCEAAPTIEDGESEVVATIGSRARLICDAVGRPKPEFTWLKDGNKVETSSSRHTMYRTGSLQVSKVTVDDSGLYECIATNNAGTARREIILSVQGTVHHTPTPDVYKSRKFPPPAISKS